MKIVIGHTNADLDSIACMVAMTRLEPDAIMVEGTNMKPSVQRFLAIHKDIYPMISTEVAIERAEEEGVSVVYVVDTADSRRVAEFSKLLDFEASVIIFDHHPASDFDIEAKEKTIEPVGACVTLLVEKMRERDIKITPQDATLYMLALYSDTGRLSYNTTTSRDIAVAEFLLRKGAKLRIVNRYMSNEFSDEQVRLLSVLLGTKYEISVGSVEFAVATAEFDFNVRGAALVVQKVMDFGGHSAILAIIRTKNRIQLITRSQVSYFDVGELCRQLGGGGHSGAGSAAFKNESLDSVKQKVLAVLDTLEFDPVRVHKLMSQPLLYLDSESTIEEARCFLSEKNIHGAPILKETEVVGMISVRDIKSAFRAGQSSLPVTGYMTTKVESIDFHEPIDDALDRMTERDIGRLIVTQGNERVGILTRTDLLRKLYMVCDSELESIE